MRAIDRRAFVKGAAVSAAGLWVATNVGLRWVRASDLDPAPFRYGVASGDPMADRVVIWTHVDAVGPVDVAWEVATDAGFGPGSVVRTGSFPTDAARDHTVKADVEGLDPNTTYWYRFSTGGETSRTGRTRTAPGPGDPVPFAFALASCQNLPAGWYAAWRHIAARDDLAFVLQVGDYIYEGGGGGIRPHEPAHEILTVDDYRTRYRNYRSDPDLRAAHATHPFVTAWDDHEVTNNSWREGAQNHQAHEGDYLERRNAAYQVYDEWMPIRLPAGRDDAGMRIYRKLGYGGLADVLVLDTRQYRDEQTAGNVVPAPAPQLDPANGSADRTFLGAEQKAWLKQELAGSSATWRLLGNQAMFAQFTYGTWPDEVSLALQDLTGMPPDGYTVNNDQWDGYQAEQKEILTHLRDAGVDNTVVLTGDIHMSFANEVYVDEGKFRVEAPVAAEFIGPSITSSNLDDALGIPPRTGSIGIETIIKLGNPHIRYVETDSNGYVVGRVTADEMVGEWYHLSDVRDANAGERLATSWKVDAGDLTLKWVGGQPVAT